ncbi:hypothetical protein NL676_010086 [Syzygium grande]|nr:hypothetical protein NL676_010086 [Syzygium grande]
MKLYPSSSSAAVSENVHVKECIVGRRTRELLESRFSWVLKTMLNADATLVPPHEWLVLLFQGVSWLLLVLTVTIRRIRLPYITLAPIYSILPS